ncbi:MAG: flagellar motor switch protein FliG [Candidatus Brocadia sp. AMX2]|uniref:Flagellar motor switch protein FliG n=1 Tax=Candidatus Brocadia sinica JPN1 TaxID=1197129 RepID=A0ABQ0JZ66_9BACT|nr:MULTISPECIES: flagellar motor switch protein FliG [Brocadia]MBC6931259.1 flagellar motor switch protein FliG [Candidatus Brocadia sp.]MBL1168570.1 flagellar motor switch protein FliG [Candidatus Brocadia sp. AMX1]MCK6467223.1 flagellar motor switch protein FliG [Candidatus Brocadia sinica]NOG40104.1 flagellar motor switch protein FliG [Planctomycetota bacterium]KAA0246042.1 MAG: flagellar motor switch protein FliG [Candidatus Brocadia sp. AMX2]
MNTINLTGIQKVAILLSTLDADTAAEVIKEFNEEQIAAVTAAMSDIERVEKELVERVLYDLSEELKSNERIVKYDNNSFKKLLEKAIGVQKSEEIITSVQEGTIFPTPFSALREASDEDVIRILAGEHPQTIALVLSYVDSQRAAKVLSQFPTEFQSEIIMRIATMEPPPTKLLLQVNEVVVSKIKSDDRRRKTPAKKKYKFASEIIGSMDGSADKNVIDQISYKNPELADEIKKLLFTFEDVVNVQDEALRKILTEIDNNVIALALKTANPEVEKKFFSNMSKRVGDSVREVKDLLGPRLLSEVESAQQQIVEAVKRLEAKGEAILKKKGAKGGADKFV